LEHAPPLPQEDWEAHRAAAEFSKQIRKLEEVSFEAGQGAGGGEFPGQVRKVEDMRGDGADRGCGAGGDVERWVWSTFWVKWVGMDGLHWGAGSFAPPADLGQVSCWRAGPLPPSCHRCRAGQICT